MEFLKNKIFISLILLALFFASVSYFLIKINKEKDGTVIPENVGETSAPFYLDIAELESELSENPPTFLPNPPSIVKAVYVTSWSALSKKYLSYLDELFEATEINSVVIDIKDYSGVIFYETRAQKANDYQTFRKHLLDINDLVEHFHHRGIYLIARINIFNDSAFARVRPDLAIYSKSKTEAQSSRVLWKDSSGLHWLDPASREVWDYNIEIAKDVLSYGFDEINFDYIRFPSDGDMQDISYPVFDRTMARHLVIKEFFQEIRETMPEAKLSVDLFGQTTNISHSDMGIGQIFEDALEYFDYVCPMVYPSHYISGFIGYKNPAEYPYEVVSYAIEGAVLKRNNYAKENPEKKLAQIRPWLQSFNLGAVYGSDMVKKQIKAVEDVMGEDFNGFMLWNPLNVYIKESVQ